MSGEVLETKPSPRRRRGPRSSESETSSERGSGHVPVLLHEVLEVLDPKPGQFIIDGTFGAGGHAKEIEKRIQPGGTLLAIDWEKTNHNFADLPEILKAKELPKANGLLLDLGFSSEQLESGRGFSFQNDEPLLMTYSDDTTPVYQVLRELSEHDLEKIIRAYGEERYARRIAKAIHSEGKPERIMTSGRLASIIESAVPKNYERGRIHPATRTFQALRIYANRELENLETILQRLDDVVGSGGRVAIISFHSLEDRIVKNYFRDYEREKVGARITKKPITATGEEMKNNPRSRSAKLRAFILHTP